MVLYDYDDNYASFNINITLVDLYIKVKKSCRFKHLRSYICTFFIFSRKKDENSQE